MKLRSKLESRAIAYLNEVKQTPGDNGVVVQSHIEGNYGAADSDTAHVR